MDYAEMKDFSEWLEGRDPDERIDHENYSECAIGLYRGDGGSGAREWWLRNGPSNFWTTEYDTMGEFHEALSEAVRNASGH